jgi:hypothetical protein
MLKNLKLMLGIDATDTSRDELLNLLLSTASARLKLLLGGMEPPASMEHIIREVSIIRFNKIGSEGMGSHTVEGESLSFAEDDFASFADEIQAYLDTQTESKRGRMRFV